jgi:hypothetical protein
VGLESTKSSLFFSMFGAFAFLPMSHFHLILLHSSSLLN